MSIFVLGDTHLSFGVDKPMDIFPGWRNHIDSLANNWNGLVGEEDTVVVPGDISWAMTAEEAVPDLKFINDTLKGRKIIMKGNHDYWWQSMKKLSDLKAAAGLDKIDFLFNNAYETEDRIIVGTRGWQIIGEPSDEDRLILDREAGRFSLSLAAAKKLSGYGEKKLTAFFHYPPVFDRFVFDKLFDLMLENGIDECYFGHLHGKIDPSAAKCVKYNIVCRLVSADYLKFSPLKLTTP